MSTVLELKNISKTIGKRKIIDNLSFSVMEGEIFGFLGPNGAGKTTTIKMITGLLKIDEGEILICGKNVKTDYEAALSNVGGIIENPEMYGYLTGRTNLEIFGRMHGDISKERIDEVIDMVKLNNRIDEKVRKYSLGMRQRLGVAQALLHKPKLLILDEPTNGLDPAGIKELRDNLKTLAKTEGLAVLVSSHLLSEMELMCDRFGIIDNGKIIDVKSLNELTNSKSDDIINYTIEVSDVEESVDIIKGLIKDLNISTHKNKLQLSVSKTDIAKINKSLVINSIDVYEISHASASLEEKFMEITKSANHQIS
ncbi:ABC-2 type transport system ATP-binding protein [Clostridium collagenovorans DSM 3089]|uniref:ABC-2 type transport system ATP-binding protein n=1 Tax=Clostridium collagenovorans DSM 3089 TaxID=1121306 RepID=A0A1M5T8X4_9CLOT|nr:ABC transporter ATP-binding protein [Clostridium collagenovorans]SHH47171.1 ABC-2 type transport system ATP-binding protein [Clostridium collagenovorans DSM 3089]